MCEPCSVFFGEHKVTHQEGMTTGLLLILCISVRTVSLPIICIQGLAMFLFSFQSELLQVSG